MDNKFFTFIKPYLSQIDNGQLFRKPFGLLYAFIGILNLLLPIAVFYKANEVNIFDTPAKFLIVFLLAWVILAFTCWVSFQIWMNRRTKIDLLTSSGDDFIATPVYSHFIKTLGEWLGTFIAIAGFGYALLATIILGDSAAKLNSVILLPVRTGWLWVVLLPIIGFLIIVFTRYLSEKMTALSLIANNTRK